MSGGVVALPCDIVAADRGQRDRGQRKWMAAKNRKKVTINRRCRLHEWWFGGSCRKTSSRQAGAAQSGHGGTKKGNNQLEVWQREWWHGGNCHATSSQQAGDSANWKWWQKKKKKGNNQLEVWQREWWHGGNCHATSSQQTVGSAKWKWRKKRRKKVITNWRCGSMSGGVAATAMRHRRSRQGTAQIGSGGKKKKKGNNQLEVQAA